ncbi:MAG: hypothetical protein N2999_08280, partial [Proteobacteria bacterium]|nr:hypothetical protein [Pseudomonadota bacterium]
KSTGVYGTKTLQIKVVGDIISAKESGSWKCFIATAAYGSYLDPNVKILRDFRDRYLLTNHFGRKFVEFYYKHSPELAKIIAENEFLKIIVRIILTPIVYAIKFFNITLCFFIIFIVTFRKSKKDN